MHDIAVPFLNWHISSVESGHVDRTWEWAAELLSKPDKCILHDSHKDLPVGWRQRTGKAVGREGGVLGAAALHCPCSRIPAVAATPGRGLIHDIIMLVMAPSL